MISSPAIYRVHFKKKGVPMTIQLRSQAEEDAVLVPVDVAVIETAVMGKGMMAFCE